MLLDASFIIRARDVSLSLCDALGQSMVTFRVILNVELHLDWLFAAFLFKSLSAFKLHSM